MSISKRLSLAFVAESLGVLALCKCPEGNEDSLPELGLCVSRKNENEQALQPTYDLDTFLEKLYPNITFLQYRRMERTVYLEDDNECMVTLNRVEKTLASFGVPIPNFHKEKDTLDFMNFCEMLQSKIQKRIGFFLDMESMVLTVKHDNDLIIESIVKIFASCLNVSVDSKPTILQKTTVKKVGRLINTWRMRNELCYQTRFDLIAVYFILRRLYGLKRR